MYMHDNTFLNYCQNEKYLEQIRRENQNIFYVVYFFPENSVFYDYIHTLRICGTYCFTTEINITPMRLTVPVCIHHLFCSRLIRDLSLAFAKYSSRRYYNIFSEPTCAHNLLQSMSINTKRHTPFCLIRLPIR
jgi:hypothetical protein